MKDISKMYGFERMDAVDDALIDAGYGDLNMYAMLEKAGIPYKKLKSGKHEIYGLVCSVNRAAEIVAKKLGLVFDNSR
jgi:hypothetical protein